MFLHAYLHWDQTRRTAAKSDLYQRYIYVNKAYATEIYQVSKFISKAQVTIIIQHEQQYNKQILYNFMAT